MKKVFLLTVFLFFNTALLSANEITWITNYDEGLQLAKKVNKPLMIDFYTDWCGYCKKLDNDTYKDPDVISKANDFINVKIRSQSMNRNEPFDPVTRRYGISSFPTIVFLGPDEHEVLRVKGYMKGPQFLAEMVKAQVKTMPEDMLKQQADLGDAEAAYFLGLKYEDLNDCSKATVYFDKSMKSDPADNLGYQDDSLLGIGLCAFKNQDYQSASEKYSNFVKNYTNHKRLDEALYFAGFSYLSLNNMDKANEFFDQLKQKFPQSNFTRQYNMIISQMMQKMK